MLTRILWNSWYALCWAIATSTLLSTTIATSQPQCYWEYHDIKSTTNNDGPCGNYKTETGPFSCCSSGDTCLGNQICKGPGGSHENGSGYYLSGCTDKTLSNTTVCTTHCTAQGYPDIVYDSSTELWACCNVDASFNVNCKEPTVETWSAPAPSDLKAVFTAHSSTASATATSTTSSSSSSTSSGSPPPATNTQTPSVESSGNISHGGLIAVIIGSIIGAALLLGLTWWLIRARRKNKALEASMLSRPTNWDQPGDSYQPSSETQGLYELNNPHISNGLAGYYSPAGKYVSVPTELPSSAPSELATVENPVEMGSGRPRAAELRYD